MMIAMMSRPLFSRTMVPFVIDSSFLMTGPLLILSLGAVMLGYFTNELFLGFGSTFYLNSIFTHPNAPTFLFDATFGGSIISIIPVTFLFLILLILIISPFSSSSSSSYIPTNSILTNPLPRTTAKAKFNFTTHFTLLNYFNVFYHWIMFLGLTLSNFMFRYIDKGFLEFFGPLGFLKTLHYWGFLIELLSTGFIPHYAYVFISSLILFFIILL